MVILRSYLPASTLLNGRFNPFDVYFELFVGPINFFLFRVRPKMTDVYETGR
jgi:hypothetical protein